jgi:UDP-N-acetylglucosamine 2-epimerase
VPHVLSIVGARPQFVKASVVSRAIRRRHRESLVHTGQHYDDNMSGSFFRDLDLPEPDYHLGIGSGPHGRQTGDMLAAIEGVLLESRPDVVVVHGDTNSTLAGALAAAKLGVPLAHVEAGCRSYDRSMPEEINRVVTDHVSTLLFCPTETAAANLYREGIQQGVHRVGDVMLDLLSQRLDDTAASPILSRLGLEPRGYVLATVHRAANTDDHARLRDIVAALHDLEETVVFPVHPRTHAALQQIPMTNGHVRLLDPVGYLDMIQLVRRARLVVTDSGGVQKEAFFLGTPCITLRTTTEWMETVDAGWNCLVGTSPAAITEAARSWRPSTEAPDTAAFGDGHAADRIALLLEAANR